VSKYLQYLNNRNFLWLLLIVNFLGTVYGYIWYKYQLEITPLKFLIFVPDSPTASLFFVFVLIAFLLNRNWPLIEALAIVTLLKYGIWAVMMNLLLLIVSGELPWQGYMLIASHSAMAIQGLLYSPYYKIKGWHLVVVAIWTLHNDVIDYLFRMMPSYGILDQYSNQIGYFTFWLSVISLAVAYVLAVRKRN
jgi:uncharacterized membrane protein YpjA